MARFSALFRTNPAASCFAQAFARLEGGGGVSWGALVIYAFLHKRAGFSSRLPRLRSIVLPTTAVAACPRLRNYNVWLQWIGGQCSSGMSASGAATCASMGWILPIAERFSLGLICRFSMTVPRTAKLDF